ncbi:hypothetical protein [Massilia sp. CT11-137]|uniref:hypothetical protein n=1 Tax=Massilia sp. CT11-137 TaxID=3393901 RepID=UPI0039AF390F
MMDDVSTLGPLWVGQLRKEVAARRNRAAESLMTVNQDGAYAEQHRMLIEAANTMLAAPDLLEALQALLPDAVGNHIGGPDTQARIDAARAAIAKATGSAA